MAKPTSPIEQYLASLPEDRRKALSAVRAVIKKNLPKGYEEGMDFGMIGYGIPLSRYPDTYNGHPLGIAALASQKGYMAVYLMSVYADPKAREWFEKAYRATGKRFDMGKSCVRFRTIDDLPLDLVGQAIARVTPEQYIAFYEAARGKSATAKKPAKSAAAKKTATAKKPVAAKKTAKRPATRSS